MAQVGISFRIVKQLFMPQRLFSFLLLCLVISCKKEDAVDALQQFRNNLNGGAAKTWLLRKVYLNGAPQTLTQGQQRYTKTYKSNNTWSDWDGYTGTFSVTTDLTLVEVINNSIPPNLTIPYKVNQCLDTLLDVEYTVNQQTYRLVYGQ